MSDVEKIMLGISVSSLVGLIVWLIQANFNELKKSLECINGKIVGKDICAEKHKALEEKVNAHSKSIRHLYRLTNGELVTREEDD